MAEPEAPSAVAQHPLDLRRPNRKKAGERDGHRRRPRRPHADLAREAGDRIARTRPVERILDFAKARGWRDGPNPALWRGHLSSILPARAKLGRGHHGAMAYPDVPAFVRALRASSATAPLALEFTILTAARTGEVLGAKWDEVNLDRALWTVPKAGMKAGREHRIPLVERAVEILNVQLARRTEDDGGSSSRPKTWEATVEHGAGDGSPPLGG